MKKSTSTYLPIRQRLVVLLIYLFLLYVLHVGVTFTWKLDLTGPALWLVSAIGFLSYSLLDTPFFIPPRQALASSLTAGLILLAINLPPLTATSQIFEVIRWIAIALTVMTVTVSTAAIILHQTRPDSSWDKATYALSNSLGDGRILFTPPALLSIFAFHSNSTAELLWLTFGWAALILLQPVELAWISFRQLQRTAETSSVGESVGEIARIDNPNIIRVALSNAASWDRATTHVACLPDSSQVFVLPLFRQSQSDGVLGTGILGGSLADHIRGISAGLVYRATPEIAAEAPFSSHGGEADSADLVGFVVEDSRIGGIVFEVAAETDLEEGMVVFCNQGDSIVYYQILDARTSEEVFERNPSGTHRARATQLGSLDPAGGFVKFPWLPEMNSPVFLPAAEVQIEDEENTDEFVLGQVPRTEFPVQARFSDLLEFHTAILGVTGTGKTELVFDLIRHGLKVGTTIFCVDLTEEYQQRLADLQPNALGFDSEEMEELEDLIDAVETGEYSAAEEKKALNAWLSSTKPAIDKRVDHFLRQDGGHLGLFEISDIANTRATLRATELYLSSIFKWARQHRRAKRILIVLEEAHTVIPEFNLFPRDRADTYAVVGRMAQIALQGRKYGVGLLLISQRTALVSKSLLSQCNTVLSFAMYDKTGLDYLRTIYGEEHVAAIPNLRFLQGVAFGKAIMSDRPILFEVPYQEEKRKASEELRKSLPSEELEPEEEDDIPF